MADITNVINVQLLKEGQAAAYDNVNVVGILTSERGALNSNTPYKAYKNQSEVIADFGALSRTASAAAAFFGTSPNAVNAGGTLIVGYYRANRETIAAKAAQLKGIKLDTVVTLEKLQAISNGSFSIDINDEKEVVAGLDFRTATSIDDVVAILADELHEKATVMFKDNRFYVTSLAAGASQKLTFMQEGTAGAFVGLILGLSHGCGAVITASEEVKTLEPETKLDAISRLKALTNIYGCAMIDQTSDQEVAQLAVYAQSANIIIYDVFAGNDYLQVSTSNPVWNIKLASQTHYRCLYSAVNNRNLAVSYMARAHSVNFNGENTALTMHLKTLSVAAEDYSQTEIDAAKRVGLDIYTIIKDVPSVLTSGANDYVDNIYNLMSYINAVEIGLFNLLKGTATKIPQTTRGLNQLIDTAEKESVRFARAGFIGAGTWSSPDYFGSYETFTNAIAQDGYYWLAGSLADQTQADRQARKSPVLQNAIKNAGAIHSVDVIINFNY